jgi:hypothetical protein
MKSASSKFDQEEDKGFYIDDDGMVVLLEPIHFRYPNGYPHDVVNEKQHENI